MIMCDMRVTLYLPDHLAQEIEAYRKARPGLSLSALVRELLERELLKRPEALLEAAGLVERAELSAREHDASSARSGDPGEVSPGRGALIALLHRSDPDHEEALRGFRRLAEGGARLFLPMPVLFEVFKWLLFQAGPKAARKGLAKVVEARWWSPSTWRTWRRPGSSSPGFPAGGAPWRTRAWLSSPCGSGRPFGP